MVIGALITLTGCCHCWCTEHGTNSLTVSDVDGGRTREDELELRTAGTSEELKQELLDLAEKPAYKAMQTYRQKLPAWPLRDKIVDTVRANQVSVITIHQATDRAGGSYWYSRS